jgi:hypothetical protein
MSNGESSEDSEDAATRLVLASYTGEPCRICGVELDGAAVRAGVFSGYSECNIARMAHRACWDARETRTWAYP